MKQSSELRRAPATRSWQGHPASDRAGIIRREDRPYRSGGVARRGEHLRAVPPRGHRPSMYYGWSRSSWRPANAVGAGLARAATSDESEGPSS